MQDWGTKFGEVKLRDFFDEGGIIYMQNFRKPDWKEVDPEDLLKIPTNIIVELYLEPTNKITSRMVESAVKIGNKYAMTDRERQKKFPRLTPHKCKQCGNIFANDEDARQSKVICQECRELK